MNLFPDEFPVNILPCDGEANYFGMVFGKNEADELYEKLFQNIEWKHDQAVIYGRQFITPRKVAWYAAKPFEYKYSGVTKVALPFTPLLIELKKKCELTCGATYNSCLLNLYHEGNEGMAWHSDDEKELLREQSIASLSFGAERKFSFKHKTSQQLVSIVLEHGSLLEMRGAIQHNWRHRLPPTKKITGPRINLTFRSMSV